MRAWRIQVLPGCDEPSEARPPELPPQSPPNRHAPPNPRQRAEPAPPHTRAAQRRRAKRSRAARRRLQMRRMPARRRFRRRARMPRQRALHGMEHELVNRARIAKPHFDLRRMHVHIDRFRRQIEKQHIRRITVAMQHVFVRGAHRVREQLVAHEAAIDEEILLVGAAAARGRQARAAIDGQRSGAIRRAADGPWRTSRREFSRRARAVRSRSSVRPPCRYAAPKSRRPAARAPRGESVRDNGRVRSARFSGICGARAC